MLRLHKPCLALRYYEHEFAVATEHGPQVQEFALQFLRKRATKAVDLLYQQQYSFPSFFRAR